MLLPRLFGSLLALFLVSPAICRADAVRYGQAEISVDSVRRIADSFFSLSVGGEAAVVAAENLGRAAALRSLAAQANSGLSAETLELILRQALLLRDLDVVRAVFSTKAPALAPETALHLCKMLLTAASDEALLVERAACREKLLSEASRLFVEGEIEKAITVAVVSGDSVEWSNELRQAKAALAAAERGDVSSFWAGVAGASGGDSAKEQAIIRAGLRVAMVLKQHDVALAILMRSDFEGRSVLEHSAAQWLLEASREPSQPSAFGSQACQVFSRYAAKDEVIAALLPGYCGAQRSGTIGWFMAAVALLGAVLVGVARVRKRAGAERDDPCVSQALNPEHIKLLAFFGLPPGATLKEIKAAYRAAIKAVHPDRQRGAQRDAASEEFIEATQRYERLLRLHLQHGAAGSEHMQHAARSSV